MARTIDKREGERVFTFCVVGKFGNFIQAVDEAVEGRYRLSVRGEREERREGEGREKSNDCEITADIHPHESSHPLPHTVEKNI